MVNLACLLACVSVGVCQCATNDKVRVREEIRGEEGEGGQKQQQHSRTWACDSQKTEILERAGQDNTGSHREEAHKKVRDRRAAAVLMMGLS